MNIIYLHGFNSDGNGDTAKKLKSHYGEQIICPSYDYINADKGYSQLNSLISSAMKQEDLVLCGTSLGGFWANVFAEKYDIKCILVNPALKPHVTLARYIGTVKNFSNGKESPFTKEDADSYARYETGDTSNVYKTVFLGAKDKVVDYRPSAEHFKGHNVIVDQDEEHRIGDVGKIIKIIDEMSNTFVIPNSEEDPSVLKEHVINATPTDRLTKQKYADQVWDILQSSYSGVGGLHGAGFDSKEDMVEKIPFWKIVTRDGRVVAVWLYKDKLGRKAVAGGTDGTKEGKKAIKDISGEELKTNRAYTEVSGPMLAMMFKSNQDFVSKCVPYDRVKRMAGEEIRRPQSSDPEMVKYPELRKFFYQRFIGKQWYTKCMVGTAEVKMY